MCTIIVGQLGRSCVDIVSSCLCSLWHGFFALYCGLACCAIGFIVLSAIVWLVQQLTLVSRCVAALIDLGLSTGCLCLYIYDCGAQACVCRSCRVPLLCRVASAIIECVIDIRITVSAIGCCFCYGSGSAAQLSTDCSRLVVITT